MLTVTVAVAVDVPPGPTAVIVKVVVSIGDTMVVPVAATLPTFGVIVTESASVEVQLKTAVSPAVIVVGV